PRKNGPGTVRNARMPMYGFSVPPRSVMGSRKSQKMVVVVTSTTPVRLIQLLDRCTIGESQPRPLGSGLFGIIVLIIGHQSPAAFATPPRCSCAGSSFLTLRPVRNAVFSGETSGSKMLE